MVPGREAVRLAEEAVGRDPTRVRCLTHEDGRNHGIAPSRNRGLRAARGEYIASLDADDVWFSNKLADQVKLLDEAPHVQMVFGRSLYWRSWDAAVASAEEDVIPALRVPDRAEVGGEAFVLRMLRQEVMVPCPSSVLVRAAAARAVCGFGEGVSNLFEDQAFYVKLALEGTMLACDEVWDRYRVHGASVLGSASRADSRVARRQFLDWAEGYLSTKGACSGKLARTIRVERWAVDHPRGARVMRMLRRIRG
jgi:glycosyltransferase involved in cell wall biosynthesis